MIPYLEKLSGLNTLSETICPMGLVENILYCRPKDAVETEKAEAKTLIEQYLSSVGF